MKLAIEEKVKHRLVGIAVILSIGMVFAPALLKKSQHRFDDTVSVSIKLPPKPILPQISVRQPQVLMKAVKVAKVEIPEIGNKLKPSEVVAKVESLSAKENLQLAKPQLDNKRENAQFAESKSFLPTATKQAPVKTAAVESTKRKLEPVKPTVVASVPLQSHLISLKEQTGRFVSKSQSSVALKAKPVLSPSNAAYGVQLATFAVQSNATALIAKLKSKGYSASYDKVLGKNGTLYYKVVVGNATARQQAQALQKQLAEAVRINGFIVAKSIS